MDNPNDSEKQSESDTTSGENAEALRGEPALLEHGVSGEIVVHGDLRMSSSAALSARAEKDLEAVDSAAGALVAGGDIEFTNGGTGAIVAGGDISITNGGAQVMVVGRDLEMHTGGAGLILNGRDVNADHSFFGVVISNNVTLGEGSRILLNTRQAAVFGAALGAMLGLITVVSGRRTHKKHR